MVELLEEIDPNLYVPLIMHHNKKKVLYDKYLNIIYGKMYK